MPYYNNNRRCDTPVCRQPQTSSCGCDDGGTKSQDNLARTYVVRQNNDSPTYDIETAFVKGTIFKDLDKPFMGGCKR